MKRLLSLGLPVLALALSLALVSCGSDGSSDNGTPETVTFISTSGDATYTLTVTQGAARATYHPVNGDTYVLTITRPGSPARTSSGTVTVSIQSGNTVLALSSGIDLKVTISSSGGVTRIEGTITTNAGNEQAPGAVTPPGSGNDETDGTNPGNTNPGGGDGQKGVTIADFQGTWRHVFHPGTEFETSLFYTFTGNRYRWRRHLHNIGWDDSGEANGIFLFNDTHISFVPDNDKDRDGLIATGPVMPYKLSANAFMLQIKSGPWDDDWFSFNSAEDAMNNGQPTLVYIKQ